MYKKILVPLDGSKLAECVLPQVRALVEGCSVGKIVFMRVVEPIKAIVVADGMMSAKEVERITASMISEAEIYLKALVQGSKYGGVEVESQVKMGNVAETLVDYTTAHGVDLIVIATHGRSGVSRWVWGSIADRILRASCVPVLMVRAPGCVPGV
jgi:nucleotide-binding universal stress UspA family protein